MKNIYFKRKSRFIKSLYVLYIKKEKKKKKKIMINYVNKLSNIITNLL